MTERMGQSRVIDLPSIIKGVQERWANVSLVEVNDAIVRLGVFEGEFHWHRHDAEDELFLVLEGMLLLDVEGAGTLELGPWQGYTVPRGTRHRTRAEERTVVLMVEKGTVRPGGD